VDVSDTKGAQKDNSISEKLPDIPVNEGDLKRIWKEFAAAIKDESPHLYSIVARREPTLTNDIEVNIELLAQSQEADLKRDKDKVLDFLKKRLQNNLLMLKTKVSYDIEPEITEAVTTSDKLKEMMLKNPALNKLIAEFKLELE